jgi:hypothetical protein
VVGRISYTMANYGWCIGMLLWVLVSYVMIGWIVFQVCLWHSQKEKQKKSLRFSAIVTGAS